jgi:drug/metabolite transporter (DMT)-like permease
VTKRKPRLWLLLLAALISNIIWASSYPISKRAMAEISPFLLTSLRLTLSSLFLLPFMPIRPLRAMRWKDGFLFCVMGFIGTALATFFQYKGTQQTSASNASVLVALEPVFILAYSARMLGEKVGRRGLLSLLLAFIGVLLVTVDPHAVNLFSGQFLRGNLLVLLSVGCYSLYTIAGKGLISRWSDTIVTAFPFLLAALFLVPAALVLEPEALQELAALRPAQWGVLVYLSLVATSLTYLIWNWLLRHLPAGFVAYSLYMQPIAGAFFSWLLLGERLSASFLVGGAMIISALLIEQRNARVE